MILQFIGDKKFIEIPAGAVVINIEQDALELAALCGENETGLLLLGEGSLAEEFFDLKSGLAGEVLQKFSNYRVKAAAVIDAEKIKGRFAEMVLEANRGNHFRVFNNREDAMVWLTKS